jgi:peptidoglycan/LPS O-acetylase OafA/YrhL
MVAFWVSVLLLAPFAASDVAAYFSALSYPHLIATALQLQVPEVPGIFAGKPYPDINNAMWSIAYEFRCYAIVALIGVVTFVRQKWVWLTLFITSLALLPFPDLVNGLIRFPGFGRVIGTPATFVSVFVFFCAGACFSLFRERINLNGKWAALATVALLGFMFHPELSRVALATLGAYALFWFAFAPIPALNWFQQMDDISYGIYLYGWPIQMLLGWYFPATSLYLLLPAAFALSCVAGYFSWHFVESPLLKGIRKIK